MRAAGHREWLGKLHPEGQVFVTYNNADLVLAGAFIADKGDTKLGTNPGGDLLQTPSTRYIDFTGARNDVAQHDYFVRTAMSAQTRKSWPGSSIRKRTSRPGNFHERFIPLAATSASSHASWRHRNLARAVDVRGKDGLVAIPTRGRRRQRGAAPIGPDWPGHEEDRGYGRLVEERAARRLLLGHVP